jgi:hypothetical protein
MKKETEHTDEFKEIMNKPPNLITRYGFIILLVLLATLIFFIVKYRYYLG